jgi:hypothetical protein
MTGEEKKRQDAVDAIVLRRMADMPLHSRLSEDGVEIVKVSGGWIYRFYNNADSVFVPQAAGQAISERENQLIEKVKDLESSLRMLLSGVAPVTNLFLLGVKVPREKFSNLYNVQIVAEKTLKQSASYTEQSN